MLVKNGLCPELMKCLFKINPNPRAGQQTFVIPSVETVYMGKLSLSYFGPVVWEKMLPEKYKMIETLNKFKDEIKRWIPDCQCRLCETWVPGVGKVDTFHLQTQRDVYFKKKSSYSSFWILPSFEPCLMVSFTFHISFLWEKWVNQWHICADLEHRHH